MQVEKLIRDLLISWGEDPEREGLVGTPKRVKKAYEYMLRGYKEEENEVVNEAVFEEKGKQMVLVKDIAFYSLCEHHLLPFYGKISVAYIPNGYVIGLSKIARLVEMYSRRLQIQERLGENIADSIKRVISPEGIAVNIEATHLCMAMRGVEKRECKTSTTVFRGAFLESEAAQNNFYNELRRK